MIWSREEFGDTYDYRPVFANKQTAHQQLFEVIVEHKTGERETFLTTAEHPFFVEGMGWRKAMLLEQGMSLLDRNGNVSFTVLSQKATNRFETVYNIKVEGFSTYHIGRFGLWVHNADCCDFIKNKYGDLETKFKLAGWIDETTGKVQYLDPFDGQLKDFPDGLKASVDHILPQSEFKNINGFDKLPKDIQNELINHYENLQPMPQYLNSSKGSKIETTTDGWQFYVKESKEISPEYRLYLQAQQGKVRELVESEISKYFSRGKF